MMDLLLKIFFPVWFVVKYIPKRSGRDDNRYPGTTYILFNENHSSVSHKQIKNPLMAANFMVATIK